jgi:hypothetical protein
MSSTLAQYREARQNLHRLRTQAKKELIARFHELSAELVQVQRELLEDFGEKIAISAKPKKGAVKKALPATPNALATAPAPQAPKPAPSPLQKKLDAEQKKLAAAKAAGKPTKAIEDRIYEIEDEIRLANLVP